MTLPPFLYGMIKIFTTPWQEMQEQIKKALNGPSCGEPPQFKVGNE
jgi:hypothetical protein